MHLTLYSVLSPHCPPLQPDRCGAIWPEGGCGAGRSGCGDQLESEGGSGGPQADHHVGALEGDSGGMGPAGCCPGLCIHSAVSGTLGSRGLAHVRPPQIRDQEQHSAPCSPPPATAAHLGPPAGSHFLGDELWPGACNACFFQDYPRALYLEACETERGLESCPKSHSRLVVGPCGHSPGSWPGL